MAPMSQKDIEEELHIRAIHQQPVTEIEERFIKEFYSILTQQPENLYKFYRSAQSKFFHGGNHQESKAVYGCGQNEIQKKIQELSFKNVRVDLKDWSSFETSNNRIAIQTWGNFSNNGQPKRPFTETFVLAHEAFQKYFIYSDFFRYQDYKTEIRSEEETNIGLECDPTEVAEKEPSVAIVKKQLKKERQLKNKQYLKKMEGKRAKKMETKRAKKMEIKKAYKEEMLAKKKKTMLEKKRNNVYKEQKESENKSMEEKPKKSSKKKGKNNERNFIQIGFNFYETVEVLLSNEHVQTKVNIDPWKRIDEKSHAIKDLRLLKSSIPEKEIFNLVYIKKVFDRLISKLNNNFIKLQTQKNPDNNDSQKINKKLSQLGKTLEAGTKQRKFGQVQKLKGSNLDSQAAASVIRNRLITSGDVEVNPGPPMETTHEVGCQFEKILGFSLLKLLKTPINKDYWFGQGVKGVYHLSSGEATKSAKKAMDFFARRDFMEVIDGSSTLTIIPEAVVSTWGAKQGGEIHALPSIIHPANDEEKKLLEGWLDNYKGEQCEQALYVALIKQLQNTKATILHSYKTGSIIIENDIRNNLKKEKCDFKDLENLFEIEQVICDQLEIKVDKNEVNNEAKNDGLVFFGSTDKKFSVKEIEDTISKNQKEIDTKKGNKWDRNRQHKMILKMNELLTQNNCTNKSTKLDVFHWLKLKKMKELINRNRREMDCMAVLAEKKMICHFEVKSASSPNDKSFKAVVDKAKRQINFAREYLRRVHGDDLDGWTFCGIMVMPNLLDKSSIQTCKGCEAFCLAMPNIYKDLKPETVKADVNEWYTKNIAPCPNYQEADFLPSYIELFKRLAGYASMAPITSKDSRSLLMKSITGVDRAILPGASSGDFIPDPGTLSIKDLRGKGSGCIHSILMLNRLQQSLFDIKKLFLIADYGCGKSTVISSLARKLGEIYKMDADKKPFLILMTATNRYADDRPEQMEFVFDIAVKEEMKGSGVEVISVLDIIKLEGGISNITTVYNLLESYIRYILKSYPQAHILVEEMPVVQKQLDDKNDTRNEILSRCAQMVDHSSHFWICSRANSFCDNIHSSDKLTPLDGFCQLIEGQGFEVRTLEYNMRNSAQISKIEPSHVTSPITQSSTHIQPGVAPNLKTVDQSPIFTTTTGQMPTLIPIQNSQDTCPAIEYTLKNILKFDHTNPNDQVVIMCFQSKQRKMISSFLNGKIPKEQFAVYEGETGKYEEIKNFLGQQTGILLTTDTLFSGMESQNIIFLAEGHVSQRSACMRAISSLTIITENHYLFANDQYGVVKRDTEFCSLVERLDQFCLEGNVNKLKQLLEKYQSLDVNKTNNNGEAAIIIAAQRGYSSCVELLIKVPGIDVNKATTYSGATALIKAAGKGHNSCVELLIKVPGIDVNKTDNLGQTALMWAAAKGHSSCVDLLLQVTGIHVNKTDNSGYTALIQAAGKGHNSCVEMLIKVAGIHVNKTDNSGQTALIQAAFNGHNSCVEMLTKVPGIDVNKAALIKAAGKGHNSCVEMLTKVPGIDVNKTDNLGYTALMLAAQQGHGPCVEILVKHPTMCLDQKNKDRKTATELAANDQIKKIITDQISIRNQIEQFCLDGNVKELRQLLDKCPSLVNLRNMNGDTVLIQAARKGQNAIVEMLTKVPGIDVNITDDLGSTALIQAAAKGHSSCVDLLSQVTGIDVNKTDNSGYTALMRAAERGHSSCVDLLLQVAGIDKTTKKGNTALMLAAQQGHSSCVNLLLQVTGIDVNKTTDLGSTALMLSAQQGHGPCVEILVKHPTVCLDQKNKNGKTAAKLAKNDQIKKIITDQIPSRWSRLKNAIKRQ